MNFCAILLYLVVAFFFVRCHLVHGQLPFLVDCLQALLDLELFRRRLGHFVDEHGVLFEMQVNDCLQRELVAILVKHFIRVILEKEITNQKKIYKICWIFFFLYFDLRSNLNVNPMSIAHSLVVKVIDKRHRASELIHFILSDFNDIPILFL